MGPHNRRITGDATLTLTGPAAGSGYVKTAADPAGRTITST
jgi:secreted PhoX family phosphatase